MGTFHSGFLSFELCISSLKPLSAEFKEVDDHDVVAEAFVTLSKLSVRNEFCQQLLDCGGVALIFESLSNHLQNQVRIVLR